MARKFSLDDAVRGGLEACHPATGQAAARVRDIRATRDAAHADAADKAARLAAAEGEHLAGSRAAAPEAVWSAAAKAGQLFTDATAAFASAKTVDRTGFDKLHVALGQAREDAAKAARYAAWLDGQLRQAEAELEALKSEACDFVCKEIGAPAYREVVAEVDEALERLADVVEKEARIRRQLAQVTSGAFPERDPESAGGWFTRFFAPVAASAFFGRQVFAWAPAVNRWREHAREHGYTVRPDRKPRAA
jgi:hypothetical protein